MKDAAFWTRANGLRGSKRFVFKFSFSGFLLFCCESGWQKENTTSKSRINTGFHKEKTIDFQPTGSDFNDVFSEVAALQQ